MLFGKFEVNEFKHRWLSEISGGEKQGINCQSVSSADTIYFVGREFVPTGYQLSDRNNETLKNHSQ